MLGAHFDSWHARHGRDRQRRRIGGHDGSDADPEEPRPEAAPHGAHRRCGAAKSRGCSARGEYVNEHFADRGDDAAEAGAREARRATSTSTTAPARSAASTCRATKRCAPIFQSVAGAVQEPRHDHADDPQHRRHRSPVVRRRRPAGLPVHPGSDVEYDTRTHHSNMDVYERVQADDMMQQRGDRRVVRLQRGEPRREAAAQAAARSPAAPAGRGTRSNKTETAERAEDPLRRIMGLLRPQRVLRG